MAGLGMLDDDCTDICEYGDGGSSPSDKARWWLLLHFTMWRASRSSRKNSFLQTLHSSGEPWWLY